MKDLLAKLEEAECGGRELDARVWCEIAQGRFVSVSGDHMKYHPTRPIGRESGGDVTWGHTLSRREFYTTSIDAALTLVPEGWGWQVRINNGGSVAYCILLSPADGGNSHGDIYLEAATAPIALVIAALRARALMGGES